MVYFVSANVYVEKVNALRKFQIRRKLWHFVPAFKVLVAVLLLFSWLTPSISAGECFREFISSGLKSGIFIFGMVNVLIVIIFNLSNHQLSMPDSSSTHECSSASEVISFNNNPPPRGQYPTTNECSSASEVNLTSISTKTALPVSVTQGAANPVGAAVPMRRDLVRAVSSMAETANGCRRRREMASLPSASTETSSQVYMRSRSERFVRWGDFRPREKRLCEIDGLSSDEFRSTVEMFIAGKKKTLLQENLQAVNY